MTQKPRGVRSNNPGNIRHGDPWQGLADKQPDPDFCTFASAAYGIRALARTLITYQDKYKLRTTRQIISRWAPPKENDTNAYVRAVATQTGRAANDQLNMQSYADLRPLVEAIIRHENGAGPLPTANTWYDAQAIDKGLALAGVEPPRRTAGPVPVTRETVGATATAGVGISQLAETAPAVMDAVTNAQDSLTSGQISRVVVGVVLVALAVFIAWSQVSKHKAGVL
ncbi:hypothetical protein [Castellaniella caeni]|uniref:hypothetical protein n=1 Tax=Castellaniella caeni TaxID=266123 RepID=UPI000C9F2AC6|nr:hypothetical protein [Castellaniella caeni]